jgi:hypothetical protein
MRRLRRHLSPALVVSCLALLVALGGTGYAAIALPPGSVGTKQLKNGAVTASKVKLRSLLARNFRPGQLPRGPRGAQGLTGAAGPQGPGGPQGAPGAKGDPATRLFASVRNTTNMSADPELGPSSGAADVDRVAGQQGAFEITFNQDINNCAVLATPGATGGEQLRDGMAAAQATAPREVTVKTFGDTMGNQENLDFTVAVFC